MGHFLGIDAGGTKTRALLISSEGRVLGVGQAGTANWNNVGLEAAVAALQTATERAWSAAGLAFASADAAFIGAAGIKTTADGARLADPLVRCGVAAAGRCVVGNDTEAALAGGLPGQPGIALVAGTGSFCLGRDARGRNARCGGWGWAMDDIGSGFWLGREALRAVAFASDHRGPPTSLVRLLDRYEITEADGLLACVYRTPFEPGSIAGLAGLVIDCAREGDVVATQILQNGAHGLAELVRSVAVQLPLLNPDVVIVGGVGRSGPPYEPMITDVIQRAVAGAHLRPPALPPVAGAALRALELVDIEVTPTVVERLRLSLNCPDL